MLDPQEVAKHKTGDDLWLIVKGQAYDLTDFAPEHPGGMRILLKYAGIDATYVSLHTERPSDAAAPRLPPSLRSGFGYPALADETSARIVLQ